MLSLLEHFVMARKRTFRGTKKNVFVKPNEQYRACSNICHGEKTHFSRNEKEHVWGMANAFGDVVDCMCGSPLLMFDGKSTTKLTEQRNF